MTSARPPTIAWIVLGTEGYGIARATLEMARELSGRGVNIAFISIAEGALTRTLREESHNVAIVSETPAPSMGAKGVRYVAAFFATLLHNGRIVQPLRRAILSASPDWIHFGANTTLPLAGVCARTTRIPAYWHIHNTIASKLPFGIQPRIYRILCRTLRIVPLANSRHTACSLTPRSSGIRVLYPGIDDTQFSPNLASSPPPEIVDWRRTGTPIFLSMARLVPDKAQDRIIEAAIRIIQEDIDICFAIAGGPLDTEYARRLNERIHESGTDDRIRLVGPVNDPRRWYSHCDVYVNSRKGPEPFGLSIIEAMLMEKPVLAYALGGPTETVADGETGWLIQRPTVEDYRQGLLKAIADRHRWTEMGKKARQVARSRFTVSKTVDRYLEYTLATNPQA